MERLERKAKKYDDERESLAENINAINKDIATQKVYTHTTLLDTTSSIWWPFFKLTNRSAFTGVKSQ